jgi:2-polyprenyl-3-methyl-5-hydroxy-6-metoxy-1,4-benzoquinol methylase
MPKHTSCILCKSGFLKPLKGFHERHGLIKCKSCGLVFMENIPTPDELNAFYSQYSYMTEVSVSPMTVRSYQNLLDAFEPFRKTNKILDVGCGRGWFLQEAKKRGWHVYGTEYSPAAIALCEKAGLIMKEGQLNADSFASEEFDVITSIEVLEHINNPREEMAAIYKFLRKGGLFYCTTPNFNSYLRYYLKADFNVIMYPEHLTYYTRATLKRLMKSSGFNTLKVLTTGISITRMKASKKTKSSGPSSNINIDEKIRERIHGKWYLNYLKNLVNFFLSLFGLGFTLKGYFIKK